MNLNQINPKNFILALFKRDDGERLLLGAGLYEFRDGLQHFQPNIIANDIVEKQGTDGQLLAGQVLRSATQPFDGFIGDATTTRPNIEAARRAFIQYFQANHRYKVIYILPDGSAIQRQNGYLVDAPSVPEMTQKFPEYHVALAFEDIHYYSYAENPDGSETYAQIYEIDPSGTLTGGLVWIANGVEWDGSLRDFQAFRGDTNQPTLSGKNLAKTLNGNYSYASADQAWTLTDGEIMTSRSNINHQGGSLDITTGNVGQYATGTSGDSHLTGNGGTYTVSLSRNGEINKATGQTTRVGCYVYKVNSSNTKTSLGIIDLSEAESNSLTINLASDEHIAAIVFYSQFCSYTDVTFEVQLEAGSTATPFEPYCGGTPSPNPDYPQPIQTVTGTQTIAINGQAFPIDLGAIELNDLGNGYQDEIVPDGAGWKIRKKTGHDTRDVQINGINGNTSSDATVSAKGAFAIASFQSGWTGDYATTLGIATLSANIGQFKLNTSVTGNASAENMQDGTFCQRQGTNDRCYFRATSLIGKTGNEVRAILAPQGGVNAWWGLQTPIETTITDAALIAQLDAIKAAAEAGGDISIAPAGDNLAIILDAPETGEGGAIWEDSGGIAAQPVTNNGIATASPIWTVNGEAENPTIINETTGQTLTFTGTIPNGQTLVVDCGAQTANIAGVDVKAQISGQWITIEPGTNLIAYSGASTNGPATIKWNEVIE